MFPFDCWGRKRPVNVHDRDESHVGNDPQRRGRKAKRLRRGNVEPSGYRRLAFEPLESRSVFAANPYLLSLVGANAEGLVTGASVVTYTATFSETVTGVSAADFVAVKGADVKVGGIQVTPVSGSVYTVSLTGVVGNGSLGLNLVDDGSIRDIDGNHLMSADGAIAFQSGQTATADNGWGLATGDFNGDGRIDLAYSDVNANTVTVLQANVGGGYTASAVIAVGNGPIPFAAIDINKDGKLDLVVSSCFFGDICVALGNGDGTFQAATYADNVGEGRAMTIADFDGDGKLDVATANYNSSNVSLFLGNGNGTFQTIRTFSAGSVPTGIASGDLNKDGKVDLVVSNSAGNTISILYGNGNGTFKTQQTVATGLQPLATAVGDIDGDGNLDIAVAHAVSKNIGVLLGNGNGTFKSQTNTPTLLGGDTIQLTDLSGDGKLDVVLADATAGVNAAIGNGDGTFQPAAIVSNYALPIISVGDVNGDSRADIVVYERATDRIQTILTSTTFVGQTYTIDQTKPAVQSIVRESAEFTNAASVSYLVTFTRGVTGVDASDFRVTTTDSASSTSLTVTALGTSVYRVTVGGVSGNGQLGIRFVDDQSIVDLQGRRFDIAGLPTMYVASQDYTLTSQSARSARLVDINKDGKVDMITVGSGTVTVLLGNGNGTFQAERTTATAFNYGTAANSLLVDLNNDGNLDVVNAGSNSINVLLGNGDGSFKAQQTMALAGAAATLVAKDLNADGKLDLVATGLNGNGVGVFRGNGNGTFVASQTLTLAEGSRAAVVGDFNGDGKQDLIVGTGANTVNVALGNGNGTFQTPTTFNTPSLTPSDMALGDFNLDGKLDLAVLQTNFFSMYFGNGNGTFRTGVDYSIETLDDSFTVADIDFDGDLDIAVTVQFDSQDTVYFNNGDGSFQTPVSLAVGYFPKSIAMGDVNGDGRLDLASAWNASMVTIWYGAAYFAGPNYTIDNTLPTVATLARSPGVGTLTSGVNVEFRVTFGESVTGVDASDFVIAASSGVVASSQITVIQVSGSTYAVRVGGIVGDGTLGLNLVDDGTILDLAGNRLSQAVIGEGFTTLGAPIDSVYSADFNNDGKLDLLVFDGADGRAKTLLGNGDGTFKAPLDYWVGFGQTTTSIADYNGDGKLDLGMEYFTTLYIALGNGDGTFQSGIGTSIGWDYVPSAGGDLNGDGKLDYVMGGRNNVAWLLGNGNGTFQAKQSLAITGDATAIALRDFNGDGALDLIATATTAGTVNVFFGNGNGTFQAAPITTAVGNNPKAFALADVDGDGKLDLAVANSGNGVVSFLLGNGDGSFRAASSYAVGGTLTSIAIGDFDADGKADLIVGAGQIGPKTLLGRGDGTFQASNLIPASRISDFIALGDFNGDGRVDVASASLSSNGVGVFLGHSGNVFFGTSYTIDQTGPQVVSIAGPSADGSRTNASSIVFTVTFNEAVTGFDATDYFVYATGGVTWSTTAFAKVSDSVYTVTVGGIVGYQATGTLNLWLTVDGTVRDLAGNALNSTAASFTFRPVQSISSGLAYNTIAADFNGDGVLDIVEGAQSSFSILLGNGNGTFLASQSTTVASLSVGGAMISGDVNGDGKLDLVATSLSTAQASVLLGNGNGTFQAAATFAIGSATVKSIALADLNGDGKLDLVVPNTFNIANPSVGVLLGNGNGTFQAQQTIGSSTALNVNVADVNNDGKLDLVVNQSNSMATLLGNGDGTFQAAKTFAVATAIRGVTTVDFNGDGKVDIAGVGQGPASGGVWLGNGDGTFRAVQSFASLGFAYSITAADFNGDGRQDLFIPSFTYSGASLLFGNGDGTFRAPQTSALGTSVASRSAASGDFNGDGRLDMAVGSATTNATNLLFGTAAYKSSTYTIDVIAPSVVTIERTTPTSSTTNASTVEFTVTFDEAVAGVDSSDFALVTSGLAVSQPPIVTQISGAVYKVTVGRITGNGTLGLNLLNDGGISDVAGNKLRSVQSITTITVGTNPSSVVTADFNNDGLRDLIVSNRGSNSLSIFLGNGNGTFQAQQTLGVLTNPNATTVGDFNSDGKLDVAIVYASGTTANLLLGNGNGTFQAARTFTGVDNMRALTAADLNGDGKLDLAYTASTSLVVGAILGNGDGTFKAAQSVFASSGAYSITTADVNGDGKLDVITGDTSNGANLYLGNGNGTFQSRSFISGGAGQHSIAIGDVDGDGKLDLAMSNSTVASVSVLLGNGNGTFKTQTTYGVGPIPYGALLADFNGDGKLDIVTSNGGNGTSSVLFGNGNGTFQPSQQVLLGGTTPKRLTSADLNNDGSADIVFANYGSGTVSVELGVSNNTFVGPSYTIDTAPVVVGVYARGVGAGSANWNSAFLGYLATNNLGDALLGYLLSTGGTQLKTLPWSNVNTISIRFSEEVTIAQGDLAVIPAANGSTAPNIIDFSWDSLNHTGTWTFASALPRGKFLLHLGNTIIDSASQVFDGEWTVANSRSSGDGAAGGDFNFRFNVLPGDFDGNNGVTITEVLQARNRAGKGTGSVGYAFREDIDGNGNITITEVLQSRNRTATSITGLNEPVAPGSTPQSPLELAPLIPGDEDGLYVSPYASLTEAELAPIVDEAIARWEASGLVPENFDWSKLRFAITDLGPAYLGLGNPDGSILLDDDGAGWGWFVDQSPTSDDEFATQTIDVAVAAHMDLLTVVMHEIGHALGYPTGSAQDTPAAVLMSEFLGVGTRRTPGLAPADSSRESIVAPADLLGAGFDADRVGPLLTRLSAVVAPSLQDYAIYALSSFTAEHPARVEQTDDSAKPRTNKWLRTTAS